MAKHRPLSDVAKASSDAKQRRLAVEGTAMAFSAAPEEVAPFILGRVMLTLYSGPQESYQPADVRYIHFTRNFFPSDNPRVLLCYLHKAFGCRRFLRRLLRLKVLDG